MWQQALIGLASGVVGWTLLEYVIHYPLGHLPKGKSRVSREHLAHHKDVLYFSPLPLKLLGAVPVLGVLGAITGWLVGAPFAVGFTLAVAAGWTTYELLHQAIHVRGPRTRYGRWAARNHLYHHFVRPNRNHGVTTPLWDHVFRTHDPVDRVALRERDLEKVAWLAAAFADPGAAPAFVADYETRSPRTSPAPARSAP